MKSAGHIAYDAFRVEVAWLPEWHTLPQELQDKWSSLANETMSAADSGGGERP